jgi:m7GpppX diphosphatase
LEYKSEKEKIKYDTASENQKNDDNDGFILLPDLKWSGKISELYLLAIVKKRNIKSLRDLTADHLQLLKNILNKGSVCTYTINILICLTSNNILYLFYLGCYF